eukprot:6502228-Prymnesium_polylepis.1
MAGELSSKGAAHAARVDHVSLRNVRLSECEKQKYQSGIGKRQRKGWCVSSSTEPVTASRKASRRSAIHGSEPPGKSCSSALPGVPQASRQWVTSRGTAEAHARAC